MATSKGTTIVTFVKDNANSEIDGVQIDGYHFRRGKPVQISTSELEGLLERHPTAEWKKETATKERVALAEEAEAELDAMAAPNESPAEEPIVEATKATSPRVSKQTTSGEAGSVTTTSKAGSGTGSGGSK